MRRHCEVTLSWSGDESDPIPWSYWVWAFLYRLVRRARHLVGVHDWHPRYPVVPFDQPAPRVPGHLYCDWCGETRAFR